MQAHNANLLDVVPTRHLDTAVKVNGRLLRRSFRAVMSVATLALTTVLATTVIAMQSSRSSQTRDHTLLEASAPTSTCPWIAQSLQHSKSAQVMANEVIAMMTLAQKADFVILATYPPLENSDIGVPSLCIPPITLPRGESGPEAGDGSVAQTCSSVLPRRNPHRFRRGSCFQKTNAWSSFLAL